MNSSSGNRWLERVRTYYRLQNLLLVHPDLPLWIVQWDGRKRLQWWELNEQKGRILPFHFEIYFGKEKLRDEHYERVMTTARETRAFTTATLFGFADAFYALPVDREGLTFLYSGQFTKALLDWQGLRTRWEELTGQGATSASDDFVRFVRMALEVPVLEAGALLGLQALMELYADAFESGLDRADLEMRAEDVKVSLLEHWPDVSWVDSAVSGSKFHLSAWQYEGQLSGWMGREMGICRIPTTAMTLMPLTDQSERMDAVEALVRAYQIQHACLSHVRKQPETAATRLGDYGVTFVTSTTPGKNAARTKLELKDRALELRSMVRTRFSVDSVVGIGRSVPEGEPLQPSYREAVVALHLCVQLDKELLFYGDKEEPEGKPRYSELHALALELGDAFLRAKVVDVKMASDQYVRLVLGYAGERIEVVRAHFLAMLFQLIDGMQKRYVLGQPVMELFADELSETLEGASSVAGVIEGFKNALERLNLLSSQSLEGPKSIRLGTTLQYLKDNFAEPLRLPDVARKAGFSVPAFSRTFRQATGTSFLVYLRNVRIEHARLLLRTTPLSAEQIAQASGFQSQHHLIRSFKKVTGQTPGSYRKEVGDKKSGAAIGD